MENQTHIGITKDLLRARGSMEKAHDFVNNSLGAARRLNPVSRVPVLELHQNISILKRSSGAGRQMAAAQLAHSLLAHHRALTCERCGAHLTHGKDFCGQCGQKAK